MAAAAAGQAAELRDWPAAVGGGNNGHRNRHQSAGHVRVEDGCSA